MAKEKLMKGETPLSASPPGPKGIGKQLIDGACILLNIASTVTLVFLNKWYVCKESLLRNVLIVRRI